MRSEAQGIFAYYTAEYNYVRMWFLYQGQRASNEGTVDRVLRSILICLVSIERMPELYVLFMAVGDGGSAGLGRSTRGGDRLVVGPIHVLLAVALWRLVAWMYLLRVYISTPNKK